MVTSSLRLQLAVFALVSSSFLMIYITQPVLPVLQQEFSVDVVRVSFTVSAVVLGIALANLPFGMLADRYPVQPIILTGGFLVAVGALICMVTTDMSVFIGARFMQGLFIPALTTCLVAFLARNLPVERLNVVMGSYVSATVIGGLGGRLLGGWIHEPLHWRYAFTSAMVMLVVSMLVAMWVLPLEHHIRRQKQSSTSFLSLLKRWDLLRIFFTAASSFFVFSTIFNYLPFRLAGEPFHFSVKKITALYLVYVMGIFMGPMAGKFSNRYGGGTTLLIGSVILAISLLLLLTPLSGVVLIGLLGVCTGFFAVHAAAVGTLNQKLSHGQGRANALYVLFYYIGGWVGMTLAGFVYQWQGWSAVIALCLIVLAVPFSLAVQERRGYSKG